MTHWSKSDKRTTVIQQRLQTCRQRGVFDKFSQERVGEANPNWKGDHIKHDSGRARARRQFIELQPCRYCGSLKTEHHHKDSDEFNNVADNLEWVCRRCHMRLDGRIHNLRHQ